MQVERKLARDLLWKAIEHLRAAGVADVDIRDGLDGASDQMRRERDAAAKAARSGR